MMPYYKVTLLGGKPAERYEFQQMLNLRPADYTGHLSVFYKQHSASMEDLTRDYRSLAGGKFEVEIAKSTKKAFNGGH